MGIKLWHGPNIGWLNSHDERNNSMLNLLTMLCPCGRILCNPFHMQCDSQCNQDATEYGNAIQTLTNGKQWKVWWGLFIKRTGMDG